MLSILMCISFLALCHAASTHTDDTSIEFENLTQMMTRYRIIFAKDIGDTCNDQLALYEIIFSHFQNFSEDIRHNKEFFKMAVKVIGGEGDLAVCLSRTAKR